MHYSTDFLSCVICITLFVMKWTACNSYFAAVAKNESLLFCSRVLVFSCLHFSFLIFLFHSAFELLVLLSQGLYTTNLGFEGLTVSKKP